MAPFQAISQLCWLERETAPWAFYDLLYDQAIRQHENSGNAFIAAPLGHEGVTVGHETQAARLFAGMETEVLPPDLPCGGPTGETQDIRQREGIFVVSQIQLQIIGKDDAASVMAQKAHFHRLHKPFFGQRAGEVQILEGGKPTPCLLYTSRGV